LFDEEGEPLTPSHAVKDTRRYRHYVSHKLIEGKADRTHRGWRLPAAQIEQVVADAARRLLDDQTAVLDAIQSAEVASHHILEIWRDASAGSSRLESSSECSSALAALIDRVDLSQNSFRLALKLPTQMVPNGKVEDHASVALSRFVPMQIRRRGVELRLV
jgi:site-specific DNA recombinase